MSHVYGLHSPVRTSTEKLLSTGILLVEVPTTVEECLGLLGCYAVSAGK